MMKHLSSKFLIALAILACASPVKAMIRPDHEDAPAQEVPELPREEGQLVPLGLDALPVHGGIIIRIDLPDQGVPAQGEIRVIRSEGHGALGSPAWYPVSEVYSHGDWISFLAPRHGIGRVRYRVLAGDLALGEAAYDYPRAAPVFNPNPPVHY